MSSNYLATKSNLMKLQESLKITKQGYELLERKRLILTKELEKYLKQGEILRKEVSNLMEEGKTLIRNANIDLGIDNLINIANGVKIDDYIDIKNVTLMGTEIPSAVHKKEIVKRNYGFYNTTNTVDEAILKFNEIQEKLIDLAILENTIFRLRKNIEKVRGRANALQNIIIPENEKSVRDIADKLDERDREEFARLKVVKKKIN
jgi:V/A-type H+-transporting ATPase subunit D